MGRFVLPLQQVFDASGRLGAGFKLHFYQTGTSTPLDSYSDSALAVANPNPMVADADGRFDDIFLADQPYKVTLSDADDVLVWTADPVQTPTGELGVPIPIDKGGTGSASAGAARTALGLGTASTYDVGDAADEVPTNSMVVSVPTGGIILWYGASGAIPAGWALCNGATYSRLDGSGSITAPDLRDRFVVGATSTYAVGATGGATSGTTSAAGASGTVTTSADGDHNHGGATDGHTLTLAQTPSHRHLGGGHVEFGTGDFTSPGGYRNTGADTGGTKRYYTDTQGGGGSHSHGLQASGTHTHTVSVSDHTHTVATVPPFYSLCYIMRL